MKDVGRTCPSALSCLSIIISCLLLPASANSMFEKNCVVKIKGLENGTVDEYRWNGTPYGIRKGAAFTQPVLTTEGCKAVCGTSPQLNTANDSFQILTTWVLPVLALFSNLPFESTSKKKTRTTLEALVNWIGSPQSAFTTTLFNIYQMGRCKQNVRPGPLRQRYIDSYFTLSCINQYYYPRYSTKLKDQISAKMLEDKRNRALFFGLFRPLSTAADNTTAFNEGDVREISFLLANLAFQLRMLRRRGVYPMTLNIIWFYLAYIISLVLVFPNMGNSTFAHSLALGLALSWLPALVILTIVDRNPVSPTRCRVLIERFLFNVNAIIEFNELIQHQTGTVNPGVLGRLPMSSISSQAPPSTPDQAPAIRWWRPGSEYDECELEVGGFVGQGRRVRHCGVTNTVLDRLEHPPHPKLDDEGLVPFMGQRVAPGNSVDANGLCLLVSADPSSQQSTRRYEVQSSVSTTFEGVNVMEKLRRSVTVSVFPKGGSVTLFRKRSTWRFDDTFDLYKLLASDFEKDLVKRPLSWWVCWACSGIFVSTGLFMAIMVSFNTPTIGLGCRSLSWLVFWILSSTSWLCQAAFQEPPRAIRWFSVFLNSCAFLLLLAFMMVHMIGGFENCICRTSQFGTSKYGGYTALESAEFTRDNYPIVIWWAVGSSIAPLGGIIPILWTLRRWARSSELWKSEEEPPHAIETLERPMPGDLRQWDGDPLLWLM